jgi:hypothetical protein
MPDFEAAALDLRGKADIWLFFPRAGFKTDRLIYP